MKVHTIWKIDRTDHGAARLRWWEWSFLLLGLVLLDIYIWSNTSAVLWQAYEDQKFDETLRGPAPLPPLEPPPTSTPPSKIVGRLEIPHLHLAVMVQEGVDARTLRHAVGHIPGTALPGTVGNVGVAGHRDTFFRALRNIRLRDVVELQTASGKYQYVVESARVVPPRDVSVLAPTGGETLTLVTCYPFYYVGSAPTRFVVHAALVVKPSPFTSSLAPDRARSRERVALPIR
jgi:sortase A